jgi:hypothetical protein
MLVETFECTETAAEPIEATEEAIAIMESLGLEGQKALVAPNKNNGFEQRCPYREITAEERFVYRILCPVETTLKAYSGTPIPLRVLQIASHAESLGIFTGGLRVWDRASVTVKDPVLVGYTKHAQYSWMEGACFILARWGEELETFATLLKRATAAKREELKQEAQRLTATIAALSDADIVNAGFAKRIAWDA